MLIRIAIAALLGLSLLACRLLTGGPEPAPTPVPTSPPAAPTATTAAIAPPTAAPTPSPVPSPATAGCGYGPVRRLAELQDRNVREASALVASRRTPGLYWTLNDSGNEPALFAFDQAGRRLGTFRVDNAQNEDWESLQLGPGRNGEPALYVGDTGDNRTNRRESIVYRLPEPEVSLGAERSGVSRTPPAEAFRFSFPGGARDVEALLVHPTTGELLFVSKEFSGRSRIFRAPRPLDPNRRMELEQVGELDVSALGPLGNLVTDAAVAPDARRLVVRTYVAALEFDLPEGAPLTGFWTRPPRTYPLDDGPQGEGITYRADGQALLTIGESTPAVLWQAERRC